MGELEQLKAEFATCTDPARRLELVKQMGEAFLALNQLADARRAFEAACKFAPQDLAAINGARRVVTRIDPHAALDWFDRELKTVTDETAKARVYKELGELYQNYLNDFENAQNAFALARQGDPRVFDEVPPQPQPVVLPPLESLEALPALPPLPSLGPPPPGNPGNPGPVPAPVQEAAAPAAARSSGSVRSAQRPARNSGLIIGVVGLLALLGVGAFVGRTVVVSERPPGVTCEAELVRLAADPAHPDEEKWDCVGKLTTTRWTVVGTRVVERAQVSNGNLEGEAVRMPSEEVRIEGGYVQGAPSGVWRTLRNDLLESDETFVNGKRNGPSRRYGLDGGVVEEQVWANDLKHGDYSSYSSNGKMLLSGHYEQNAKSGKWTRFDQMGRAVEVWREPRGAQAGKDAGAIDDEPLASRPEASVEELYAGQTLANWKIRHAEVRLESKKGDRTLEDLLLHRAALAGLKLNAEGTLEPAP